MIKYQNQKQKYSNCVIQMNIALSKITKLTLNTSLFELTLFHLKIECPFPINMFYKLFMSVLIKIWLDILKRNDLFYDIFSF